MDSHSDSSYKRSMTAEATSATDSSSPAPGDLGNHPSADSATSPPTDLQPPTRAITIGQQIAGGLLCINAVFVLLSAFVIPADPKLGPMFAPERSIIPALIDVLIGVSLLSRKTKYITWAIVRAVVGMTLFAALAFSKDGMMAASFVMLGTSLLLLLVGNAGRPRMAIGSAVFFVYALLNLAGLSATILGINPLGPIIQSAMGDIESAPAVVVGDTSHYRVKKPSHHWYLRTSKAAKKTNELSDRWLTQPERDAHVMIIVEKTPGLQLSADVLTHEMVKNAKNAASELTEVSREPMRSHPKHGRIVHLRATVDGQKLEYLSGAVSAYERSYQLIAFASERSFPKVEAELRSILESFTLPTDERPGPPSDALPGVVHKVVGQAQPYELTAPDDNYFLRTDEAAKGTNPLADRWLVRPDVDAHIMIIAERVEGADLQPDHYARAVAEAVTANPGATLVSSEVLKSQPKVGRILHVKATTQGLPIEYYYGCFARGEQAFQVVAFTSQEDFPALAESFRKAIDSFVLPPPVKIKK